MTMCDHCGGTFFPESLEAVVLERTRRRETFRAPEPFQRNRVSAFHMTDGLHESLASFLPASGPLPDPATTVSIFGIPRCEGEVSRVAGPPSSDQTSRDGVADAEHLC